MEKEAQLNAWSQRASVYHSRMIEASQDLNKLIKDIMKSVQRVEFDPYENDVHIYIRDYCNEGQSRDRVLKSIDYCNGEIGFEDEDECVFFLEDITDDYDLSYIIDEILTAVRFS